MSFSIADVILISSTVSGGEAITSSTSTTGEVMGQYGGIGGCPGSQGGHLTLLLLLLLHGSVVPHFLQPFECPGWQTFRNKHKFEKIWFSFVEGTVFLRTLITARCFTTVQPGDRTTRRVHQVQWPASSLFLLWVEFESSSSKKSEYWDE